METYVDFSVDEVKNLSEEDMEGLVTVLEGDTDFQKEIEEITSSNISSGELSCTICLKSFKTSSSLTQHSKSHIDTYYTSQIVFSLLLKAKNMLYCSGLHSDGITEELKQYSIEEKSVTYLTSYLNTIKMKDTEQLYNRMFNDLMKNSGKYFFKLSPKAATIVCMKFVEMIITSKNKEEMPDEVCTKNLSEKEIAGMQYLAGYVLRKVFFKLRTKTEKSEANQQAMALILAAKTSEKKINLTYVEELSRGGLWEVSDDMEKVFMITEKYFSIKTSSVGLRTIPINTFVDNLIKFPPLILTFHNVAGNSDLTIEENVLIDTLSCILTLYLRVRAFSLTKDLVAKMRQKNTTKKSLRKSIKLASKNEDTK